MASSTTIDNVSGEGLSPQSKEFGVYLRNLRKGKGLNQADLAKLVEITSGYYGFFEQGRQTPSLKIINRLAEALNVDYLELAMRAGYDEFVARKKEVYRFKGASEDDGEDEAEHQGDIQTVDEDDGNSATADAGTSASNGTGSQETIGAPQASNSALLPSPDDLGLSMERLDWAMDCIAHDPTYKLADQFKGEISRDIKVLVVQLYQAQTQRQLLTADESMALSYTLHG